ncbi:protein piccolo isoform X3 [Pelmatolapia mariae]|uniref:protein piccolo isoform X3 n=1 Tax=Pelmatolapia mariae TaxID=158779 RepID=UPI002FE5D547
MGNEASLEGGEGPPSGLPEGLAPDGKGGFYRVSDGTPVNLSELSEEQRRQLSAAMSRAQGRQPGGAAAGRRPSESDAQQRSQQVGTSRGPTGLSKSRTVDAFNQGPLGKPTPGRSPSSLSLFESRFRQEPKDPETKSSGMFGSSFLSGANPLSAVSSMTSSVSSSISSMGDTVNIPKFGLFGDEEEEGLPAASESKQGGKPQGKGPQQGPGPKGPQQGGPQKQSQGPPGQGAKPGQGPPGQGPRQVQGPPGQGPKAGQGPPGQAPPGHQAPRPGQGPPGQGPPGSQAPRPGQGPPGQGPKQGGPLQQKGGPPPQQQQQQGPGKPGPKQQVPQGPGAHPEAPGKTSGPPIKQGTGKPAAGICPLCKTTQLNVGSKDPPNYNNCTECKNQVCSLCGFSPPDSAGKEWLCLNCQMQRAMGGMDPPGVTKPKQGSAPPSPQRQASGKPGKLLIKQQSTSDQGLTPPTTPRQKSPGPTSPGPLSPGSSVAGSPKIDPKTGRPIIQKSSPQQSPAKPKQESSFFGGLGGISLGGLTDAAKPPAAASHAAESVTGKLFSGFGGLMESSKPQAQAAPKQEESVAGKLFGGFGGLTESTKPPAATSQMFSFGSSLLSSATSLVTGEEDKAKGSPPGSPPDSPADSGPGSPPDSPLSGPGSPPDSDSAPKTPPPKTKKPPRTISVEREEKAPETKPVPASAPATKENCPLCNVELNVGSTDTPNYSLCTECKKTVCNLCGFNPTPHLGEKEWLCLTCQTQRAMSGQLGDVSPSSMASPKKQPPGPVPSSTPTPAGVDSKPVVEPAEPTPPASETKVVPTTPPESTPDSALISPNRSIPPPENSSQSEEQNQTLANDNIVHSEKEVPVVEPANLTPQASETKVVPTTPTDSVPESALISPNHIIPPPENGSHSKEQNQILADEHTSHPEKVVPVVEPANLTPPTSETKLAPSEAELDSVLISPNHSTPPPENSSHDPPQTAEQQEEDENAIYPEKEVPVSESLADSTQVAPPAEQQQNSSERIAEDPPQPGKEPFDSDQQTVSELPAAEQQQSSSEKESEDHPHPCTEIANDEQQAQSATVSEIPAVVQHQSSSEKPTEDLSLPVEGETQNPLTNSGLDKTTDPAGAETEPNPKITQSEAAAPLADSKKVEPTQEKHPEVTTNAAEPKPALIPEAVRQETAPVQPDTTAASVKETTEVSAEKPLIGEPQVTPADHTPPDSETTPNVKSDVSAEVTTEVEPKNSVSPVEQVDVPEPDKAEQELKRKEATSVEPEIPSVLSEKHPVSASEGKGQANEVKDEQSEKDQEPTLLDLADKSSPVAQFEGETKAVEKSNEENTAENKVSQELNNEVDTTAQKAPEGADEGTSVEIKTNACVPITTEVKPDDEEAAEEKEKEENTVHNESNQKPLEQNVTNTENSSSLLDKKESATGLEPAATVPEEMPKEEIDIQNKIKAGTKNEPAEESIIETACLSEKSQEKGKTAVEEECTPEATVLKSDNKSDNATVISVPPPPDFEEPQMVNEVPVQSVDSVLSSAVTSKTNVSDQGSEVNLFQDESEMGSQKTKSIAENQHEAEKDTSAVTGGDEQELGKVVELSIKEKNEAKCDKKDDESQPVAGNMQTTISVSEANAVCDKEGTAEFDVGENAISKKDEVSETAFENGGVPLSVSSAPVTEPEIPVSVVSEQDSSPKEENTNMEEEKESLEKLNDEAELSEVKTVETLKEPGIKEAAVKEGSPTSPSDLAKLESTVLPILEAQATTQEEEKQTDTLKARRKLEVLPLSPDSPSSEEDREVSDKNGNGTTKKKLLVPVDVKADSLDDSSESFGKESPMSGDDEEFIRKQIMEMSENEDASPSDEENLVRRKIREDEKKQKEQKKTETVEKGTTGKVRRLTKKSTISPDDEDKEFGTLVDKPDLNKDMEAEIKEGKQQSGTGVRKFQTMELNTTSSPVSIPNDDGEPEMESLTDSPDDRSRGEGSSSLHASSFTPGTSPTSLSSLDEDSDSSSPSHIRSGEGKQHRKAKHRQPGQMLPTIEDSSEEEELREEEELLREQEKQKGSGKKSKKDKDEIRAQRRREHQKTPPSNLSPIEDASPTEEQRQEAEMEEIRRSSCSDFSPSIESDPEGLEIHAAKIAAVQKTYQLPMSVSLHSPTDDQNIDKPQKKPLRSADEAYEEIMLRAKSPTADKGEIQPEKESLYGGMLIEDYAYASLIDNSTADLEEPEKITVPTQPKKLRSPDEVYEDMIKKRKEFMQLEQEYQNMQAKKESTNPEIVLQPADITVSKSSTITLDMDGKPLLDAETAYEELMKRVLTPGTSPTQHEPKVEATASRKALHPIPDLKVTQCSSGELSSDDEIIPKKEEEKNAVSDVTSAMETEPVKETFPSPTSDQQPETTIKASQGDIVDLTSASTKTSAPVIASVSPLPTVPQYTPSIPSVVSTAPPVPPKPTVLRRANSQEKTEEPVAPPLPPPTPPKPTVFPRKAPVPLPPQASAAPVRQETVTMTTAQAPPTRQVVTPTYKPHVPPPVPPKPSIPVGIGDSHKPGHGVKPPIAPKPGSQPSSPAHAPHPQRPSVLPTGPSDIALNLSPTSESKMFQPSPKSPSSPRYASNLRDTYVVITLPSQPSSPVDSVTTHAPSSPGPASPSWQAQPETYHHQQPQPQPYSQQQQQQQTPPQTTRVPLAYTRVTESIESQEICGPEKHVSSSCHIIEAISASAQPPVVMPNLISQVVTTEVQRTTVSVVHERTPPPVPAPRANGLPISMQRPMPQLPAQNGQAIQPSEVVDLRTMKVDPESTTRGVDLSAGPDSRHQSLTTDGSRHSSAVQSPVVNLSAESSTVSIVTDSITIVTCAATIQRRDNLDTSLPSSVPLQLTKNKSFEPVSQIVYRPIDSQPSTHATAEIPINLSVGSSTSGGTLQATPVTIAPASVASCIANGLTNGTTTVSGAVDLSTNKPFNTVVSVDAASTEVVTAVITDDGKPVDLTAGKRAVCCDVVYKLPFAGSCATHQPTTPLPEDRFGYRDDHYQYDRSPYGMRGFGGIKPSMSDTNLAEAGLFIYKSKNSYNFSGTTEGAVDLTSAKISDAGEAVDYSKKGTYAGMTIPPYSQDRVTSAVGTLFGTSSVLRSSNGVVYSSVAAPVPSTYAITTQPGSIFSTAYNTLSGMHTSDTMPSLSNLQNLPLTRSHSFLSTISTTAAEEQADAPLNLEISRGGTTAVDAATTAATSLSLDTYTDASLEAIAASLEALSSPMVPGDSQYQAERERLEMEKLKQQRLAEELEWERQEIQRFREHEQLMVQKELEELQAMKQQILAQQEEERQAHLIMQKETYAQQQQQLEQIQRLQEQLRLQLEEQKLRQMYPGGDIQEAVVLGPDGTVLARKITDSGCQTDEEDEAVSKAYTAGRKKRTAKKSVDSCVQTDDEDQDEWEAQNRSRQSRPRTARGDRGGQSEMSLQAHTEISIQTDTDGNIRMDTRMELSDSERTSPKKRPTPLEIGQSANLKADSSTLQAPPKSPKVLYSPVSPCISPSKSLEFVSYDKSLGDTSPQNLRGSPDPSKASPASPRGQKSMQRSMSDPKPMSPTGEERATSGTQYGEGYTGKGSGGTPTGTQKKVKRTLPNPPSEDESTTTGQTAYSTGSARRRMCRNSNMARAKILQDIDRELDLVERESSKLRKRQAELDEEEKEIDAKLRYLEMGINRRKDALLKEREKRERAYLQSVAEDRDYMSDSEVSNIRETRGGGEDEEIESHGLERPRTAPQSELDDFVPPQTKHEYGKYSQYQYPQSQFQQSLYQTPQSYQSHSIYSSVPSLTTSQQQSYHQMLLLQQKAARQAALLSELDATKYDVISRQPDPTSSAYLGVKYDKYGNHLDLRALEVGSIAGSPMSAVSDSYYTDVDHHTPRSYMLLEDAAELAKGSTGLSSSYSLAERELAKAEKLLRRSAADLGSTDYLGSTSRLHTFGKTPDEEDTMEEPYELKLLKQQLKQEFRRSTGGTENLEQLTGLSQHYYTPSSSISGYSQRHYPKSEKYSISRLTLEKQAAKQLPASVLYQKHKTPLLDPKISSKYSSITDSRGLETDYTSYLGSTSASPRSSRLLQDEITFGLRKNIAEQQKYLGSTLGANLAGSLNLGQSLGLDSAYPSGSRSRPSSRPTSCYGLDLSIKRDPSSSSLRLKGDGEASGDGPNYQTPSGRTKPTSLPIVQSGRGRIPIVAQNSEEESPLSPVGQPMGMARASAGPLPPISADSRDQFGSCLSLQDSQQQQHIREEPTRGRSYVLLDDLQGTMSDSEAYHLRREETDWFDKPRDGRSENGQEKRQGKGPYYPFPHLRVKLQRDPKDRSVSGNGLGIRVVGGKEVPGSNGDIGAYVAKVLPGGAAEQTGKILEGMQVLEWNGVLLTGKTYEEVQGLVGQPCNEAEVCVRLDLNMLAESEGSQHLDFQEHSKGDRPPRSPGVDPKQLAAELQKVSQQQAPLSTSSSSLPATTSATSSPGQPGSPSVSKKRHSSKISEGTKSQSHPVSGEIQLQIHYDKQLGNLIVHVLQARNLAPRDNNGYSDPFVKVYLLPGRGQVMVVQNASAENKRKTKHAGKTINPEWNQTVIYKNIHLEQLKKKTLEVSVWDYDKGSSNDFLGEVLIDLSNTAQLDNIPRWLPLKEQSEGDHHRRSHSGQGRHSSSKPSSQHSSPKTTGSSHDNQDSPKSSVIKSRSHGIFPDPAKDTQVPTIEKSHSSPGTSKPSPSEGQSQSHSHGHSQHSRSHGASRSSKSAARQHHQESLNGSRGGAAVATGDAQQQSQQQPPQRLQPSQRGRLSLRHQRHSVVGVLTIQRAQSDWLPALPSIVSAKGSRADGRHLTLRKAVSEERPQSTGARSTYKSGDAPVTAASLDSGLSGSAYSLLDEEAEANEVDSAIFQVPRFGKIPNGTDVIKSSLGHSDTEGKTQVMGEIKIALKKEMKTEGEHLVLEILQCRNITYKFKTPDHLPDLYVKLYVVNIATQKRIIKKKTRVCRHDREPSFNETFRFCMNPTGHALQLFLVSNGGKFVKKTLIGEAYVWLDKVDLRKRVVSWHKLLASTAQIHS